VADIAVEASGRLAATLQSALMSQAARSEPVHLDMVYDPERRHLKIVIIAVPSDAAALPQILHAWLGAFG
jgi:hypothetical protein